MKLEAAVDMLVREVQHLETSVYEIYIQMLGILLPCKFYAVCILSSENTSFVLLIR
jgi:hypothetical protein